MFSKRQTESASLPPAKETLRQKVLCSHYTTVAWKKVHISHQDLSDPEDCEWKWSSSPSWHEAVTTLLPPAPESIIHLTMCGCKAGCKTQECKCKKNGWKCSGMCKCQNFENLEHEELESIGEMLFWKKRTWNRLIRTKARLIFFFWSVNFLFHIITLSQKLTTFSTTYINVDFRFCHS